jgi:hypothetical protein
MVAGGFAREQQGRVWRTSEAVEGKTTEGTALMQIDLGPRGGGRTVMARRAGKKGGEAEVATRCNELGEARCSQARRAPFTHIQARAYARQPTTRMLAGGRWCGSRAEAAHQKCNQAWQSYRKLRGCAGRVSVAHVRKQRRLSREQENPEVRKGVGIANQSGPIGFFLESTTSSSSYPSPIVRARPQHLKKTHEPSYQASSDPFAETSSPWQSRLSSPRITVRDTSPVILHLLQSPGKLLRHPWNLVTVELFSSPILFATGNHFLPVLLHNQGYPKVCLDSLHLLNAGDSVGRNIVVIFLFFVFHDQGLNCFDLESLGCSL